MKLILLGAPGAGKGTQAEIISKKLNIPTISTGNILREAIKNGTETGLKAKSFMDAGKLVPDDVIIGIVRERVARADCANGFILDGVPRTIPQAKALKEMLNKRGTDVSVMLNLQVEEEELINRLLERGKVSGRSDDNLETIKSRLDVYHKQTAPLADYYVGEGKHVGIHGMGTIEEIFGRIKEAVNKVK